MVPLRLFRSRRLRGRATRPAFCVFAVLFGLVFFMAQFLQTGLGYGRSAPGCGCCPGWATLMVIAPFAGALIRRLGERPLIAGGLTVVAGAPDLDRADRADRPALLGTGRAADPGGLPGCRWRYPPRRAW